MFANISKAFCRSTFEASSPSTEMINHNHGKGEKRLQLLCLILIRES